MKEQVVHNAWYALTTWVHARIPTTTVSLTTTTEVFREEWQDCDAACLRIRQSWEEQAGMLHEGRPLQAYLQRQVQHLVTLMDQVNDCLLSIGRQQRRKYKELLSFIAQLSPRLEQLLRYLLWYFPSAWTLPHVLPGCWMPAVREEYSGYHVALQVALSADEPGGLAGVAMDPILRMLSEEVRPNFADLHYAHAWAPVLLHWAEQSKEEAVLDGLLCQWNANGIAYYRYRTEAMTETLRQQPTTLAQLDTLAAWQKELRQSYVQPDKVQFADRPSIKTLLLQWIEEEYHYIEEKNKRYVPMHKRGLETDGYQPRLGMSIPVMGGLLRLMREARLLPNANQSQMLRFFAAHFRTHTKDVISYQHLRLSYYEVEQRSRQQLMEMLYLLLKELRKMS